VKALSDDTLTTGIEHLLKKCTKPILNDLDKEFKGSNLTKPVMVTKLIDVLFEKGVKGFFMEFDNTVVVNVVAKFFGKKLETENVPKEELVNKLEEETYLQGLTKFFEQFSVADLKGWCKKMKIEVASSSKRRLSRAIIFGLDLGQTNISRTYSTGGSSQTIENTPEINKTISKDDLLKYKVVELKTYCKSVAIKNTGNKTTLVDRIVKYHNGEEVEKETEPKKRARTKKSEDDSYEEGDDESKPTKKRKTQNSNENGKTDDESEEEGGEDEMEKEKEKKDDDVKDQAPIEGAPVEEKKI